MNQHIMRLVGVVGALTLTGCAVGPDFVRPPLSNSASYGQAAKKSTTVASALPGVLSQSVVVGMDVSAVWWQLFESPELTVLVEEALRGNPDLEAAKASLRQANELLYANRGSLFPSATVGSSSTREKIASSEGGPQLMTVNAASLTVTYAPDVFGGTLRQIEASVSQAEYERFQLEATYLTLTANVVNTAINLASIKEQIDAAQEIIRIQSETLNLTRSRLRLGAVSNADVLAQEAALAQSRATLPPLQKQLDQSRSQMTAYLGKLPGEQQAEALKLENLSLPRRLPLSLPSSLVEQRPDVRAAEALLHQASANIGVATANQLPQFNLTASIGSNAPRAADLFSAGTGVWSLVGSVTQSLFDAGTLKHRKQAAIAAYEESAAHYRGTVIGAFQDVSNALNALQVDAEALEQQVVAEESARASLQLTQVQYRFGSVSYVNLLNAQQTYQNTVAARVRAQATRYSDTVALFQALGGGWWNRSEAASIPPTTSSIATSNL
ncbi:efflux transporter outer membrane subunit [Pectobacterium brasiliense]|uniref:efflux transporter outer membrane subunit n=1 Tax=Pectobacterium brasiliense TaxID=180957 RepID=UPI001969046F|nr:efflux transporter outer membrane subunit [Pectobacterium brasiliense]